MKLENQVCSLDLAKRLRKLGVKQESEFYWIHHLVHQGWDRDEEKYELQWNLFWKHEANDGVNEQVSAFTVAELGEMLPKWTSSWLDVKKGDDDAGLGNVWICELHNDSNTSTSADTEADARAKMMIYLLENKLISVK